MAFLFSFHNGGAIEGADFLRYLVEVMEDAVVGFLWGMPLTSPMFSGDQGARMRREPFSQAWKREASGFQ